MPIRQQLYTLIKAGAVVTVRFPDGFSLPPWGVAWLDLSEDEQRLKYALCGDEPVHEADVSRTIDNGDEGIVIHTAGEPDDPDTQHELVFEFRWQPAQIDQLERQRRRNEAVPDGAAAYAQV